MLTILAKIREKKEKVNNLREDGFLPCVLYGPKIKDSILLKVDLKEFEKIFKEIGESSLTSLKVDSSDKKEFLVLIHEIKKDPLTGVIIHIDFFQPKLDEEITAVVPLTFEGEALACKDLGGTLVKNIHEVEVKALPQNLPNEIKVNIEKLKTFEDHILVKDLIAAGGVEILKDPEETVALVTPVENVEEELKKPIEENVEEVKKAGGKKEEEKDDSE